MSSAALQAWHLVSSLVTTGAFGSGVTQNVTVYTCSQNRTKQALSLSTWHVLSSQLAVLTLVPAGNISQHMRKQEKQCDDRGGMLCSISGGEMWWVEGRAGKRSLPHSTFASEMTH